MWQFHDGYEVVEEDGRIITLKEVTEMDSSIMELYDLPKGWFAFRETENSSWIRAGKNNNTLLTFRDIED